MKIYLFLSDKILNFSLPKKVFGSYSFDENEEEETKLINVEARNGSWFLYSTVDSSITLNGETMMETPLIANSYYTIVREEVNYLIFVTELFDNSFITCAYGTDINLLIGNEKNCNIKYECPYVNENIISINYQKDVLSLSRKVNNVYLNERLLVSDNEIVPLVWGDQINLFGLRIVFMNGFILINNPLNKVTIDYTTSKLQPFQLKKGNELCEVNFKDEDLYNKEQYFSKAPRIRRLITTKEINLSPPPRQNTDEHTSPILIIGPMLTMGIVSVITFVNTLNKIKSGTVDMSSSLTSLISAGAMLLTSIFWPTLTRIFDKKIKKRKKQELIKKYTAYLDKKRKELEDESALQKEILIENLIPIEECIKLIGAGKLNFWDKRLEQNDFLQIRLGRGNDLLDAKVNYPEEGFTIDEDELKQKADEMVANFKYIQDVPIGYSLYKCKITGILGDKNKRYGMINNIILQLITFYSYEDIKLVAITNKYNEDHWKYLKYLNHNFSNNKNIRYFSSTVDDYKYLLDLMNYELQGRIAAAGDDSKLFKPYYIIITDDYSQIKRHNFIKVLTELDINLGYSLVILDEKMSNLPSKCNNFINLGQTNSDILRDSFENQEQLKFNDEINYNVDMMNIVKILSNIPIEFEEGMKQLPESITFLEMEKVGKVEQLNIMNRWDSNDSTQSLRAEIGIDEEGNYVYLDLHEKYHGPHGLIAGMTGSGKSEFIITYILSMCINYSPDDVAFILIDYKGGGLAGAFENKVTGIYLPHLAGTITNLDKAEMDRTLVSIDSEIKRRQQIFNAARDNLGESTIDIYKYQKFYKSGKLTEAVPHLFIICDEFAELKSQQPDFMDNLISVARIGRSLGVHLILATQKPSGVVNDQIWSNSKFRVCLKVQTESDSKEMLKRPEAASIKQTGRFYLQVGFDELFLLGQSAWCGAKYYPSEKIIKQVDKNVNFINDVGSIIKSIQIGNNIKIEPQGEQISSILKSIIEVANASNKKTRRLWLNDIEPIILIDNLEQKYKFVRQSYDVKAIIGEYDAPERQEQGLLVYSLNENGNTIIYGNDEMERENLLNAVIYSICKNHSAKEINIYLLDYGSEQLRMFNNFPQIGGMVFSGEDEKIRNLFKLINDTIKERKKLLISYGGSIDTYNNKNTEKLNSILFILNNYEGLLESYPDISEDIAAIGRECERYGIILMVTCSMTSSMVRKARQCFNNIYALHITDSLDYYGMFNMKVRTKPRDILGRGVAKTDTIHEFQTASIVNEETSLNDYLLTISNRIKEQDKEVAVPIPSLPEKITLSIVEKYINSLNKVPIGISKNRLELVTYDFTSNASTIISSNKLIRINSFIESLIEVYLRINGLTIFFIDTLKLLPEISTKTFNNKKINYCNSDFESAIDQLIKVEETPENNQFQIMYIFYGIEKLKSLVDPKKLEKFFGLIKISETSKVVLCDGTRNLKNIDLETWFSKVKNNTEGIWIGKGYGDNQNFRTSKITKEMSKNYPNNYGYCLIEGNAELIKLLEFNDLNTKETEEDEE